MAVVSGIDNEQGRRRVWYIVRCIAIQETRAISDHCVSWIKMSSDEPVPKHERKWWKQVGACTQPNPYFAWSS
jgi:hypothetical protein